jgi:hypothetical protein
VNLIWFSLILPTACSRAPAARWRIKSIFSCSLHCFPFSEFIRGRLRWIGAPPQICEPCLVGAYSLGQFITARLALRQDLTHPIDIVASSLVLASFHTVHAALVNVIARYVPFIPKGFISLAISYKTSEVMHEFMRSGFEAGVFCLFEKILSLFRLFESEIEEPPLDFVAPQCLTCNICHELLVDPVEVLGFFFCKGCLETWLRAQPAGIHPVTGELIQPGTISRPAVLNIVARNYQRMCRKERDG